MSLSIEDEVREVLPELDEIEDDELREKVVKVWADAVKGSEFESVSEVPWSSTFIEVVGPDERQVNHIREVTAGCLAYADALTEMRPDLEIDRDRLVAGTLLHDVSKFYEISGEALDGPDAELKTELNAHLPHPHYGIHLVAEAGLPIEIINMVAAHTEISKVEPQTIEAKILEAIDLLVTDSVLYEKSGKFKWEVVGKTPHYL